MCRNKFEVYGGTCLRFMCRNKFEVYVKEQVGGLCVGTSLRLMCRNKFDFDGGTGLRFICRKKFEVYVGTGLSFM